jgi:hypothetical protein
VPVARLGKGSEKKNMFFFQKRKPEIFKENLGSRNGYASYLLAFCQLL